MGEDFSLDEPFLAVPPSAVDADPSTAMKELLYRVGKLEQSLQEERIKAFVDTKELLLDLILVSDDIARIVERYGVTASAQEAAIMRSVVALGRKLQSIMKHHQVAPIATVGKLVDVDTSEVIGTEATDSVPSQTVLSETRTGYTWSHGLLRRAEVRVSESLAKHIDTSDADEQTKLP